MHKLKDHLAKILKVLNDYCNCIFKKYMAASGIPTHSFKIETSPPTDVYLSEYTNRKLIIITQIQKLGVWI